MALDHSRLGLENKFLENKSGRIFLLSTSLLYKILSTNPGCINQPFILFIHHIWCETVLFIIQTSHRMQYFISLHDKLHSVNIQDDQSWDFSKTVQKISKITYTVSRFSLLTSAKLAVNIDRVTLQHNKGFIMCFFFLFKGLIDV